jgi:hypothetical protein
MRVSASAAILLGSLLVVSCAKDRTENGTGAWVGDNDEDDDDNDDGDSDDDDNDEPADEDDSADSGPSDETGPIDPTSPLTTGVAESSSSGDGEPVSPYMGGWPVGTCQDDIVPGSGIAQDFTGLDQFGETVRLYDFCNQAVVIHTGTFT